jgi:hypothetical protein
MVRLACDGDQPAAPDQLQRLCQHRAASRRPAGHALWQVLDPVNANNNVVHTQWGNIELDEFASWFAAGRDAFNRLIAHESAGNDGTVDDILADLFGNPILTHGEIA